MIPIKFSKWPPCKKEKNINIIYCFNNFKIILLTEIII